MDAERHPMQPARVIRRHRGWSAYALHFAVLFAFWLILSGRYQVMQLVIGAVSVGLLAYFFSRSLSSSRSMQDDAESAGRVSSVSWWSLLTYLVWLLFSIVKANLEVAYYILHPRMPVDPALLQFRTRLRSNVAQVVLGNSITLTPGTVTVDLKDGRYVVHALVPGSAGSLLTAEMQNRVAAVFDEQMDEPPPARWVHSLEEVDELPPGRHAYNPEEIEG